MPKSKTRIVRTDKLDQAHRLARDWAPAAGKKLSAREAVDAAIVTAARLVEHVPTSRSPPPTSSRRRRHRLEAAPAAVDAPLTARLYSNVTLTASTGAHMKALPERGRGSLPDPRRLLFEDAMRRHGGNLTHVARSLRIARMTATRWKKLHRQGKLITDRLNSTGDRPASVARRAGRRRRPPARARRRHQGARPIRRRRRLGAHRRTQDRRLPAGCRPGDRRRTLGRPAMDASVSARKPGPGRRRHRRLARLALAARPTEPGRRRPRVRRRRAHALRAPAGDHRPQPRRRPNRSREGRHPRRPRLRQAPLHRRPARHARRRTARPTRQVSDLAAPVVRRRRRPLGRTRHRRRAHVPARR